MTDSIWIQPDNDLGRLAGSRPRITIGITCFNAVATIARAVRSALAQDWPETEIVIVDDGSTDGSRELLQQLAASEPRLRLVLHDRNRGTAAARNSVLKAASGAFIAFFDDDDESDRQRLSIQHARLVTYEVETGATLVACYASGMRHYPNGYDMPFSAVGSQQGIPVGEVMARYLLLFDRKPGVFYGNGTPTCSLMARHSVFDVVGGFDEALRRQEDADFAIRLALCGAHFIGTPERLVEQYVSMGAEKAALVEHDSFAALLHKNADYLRASGDYEYALKWADLRFRHFNRQPIHAALALLRLLVRFPCRASRHFLTSATRRYAHERRMAARSPVEQPNQTDRQATTILFVCRKFDQMAGGVERMAVTIMNDMVARGFKVQLMTLDDAQATPHYDMSPQIAWTRLGMGNPDVAAGWRLRWQRLLAMRRLVQQIRPDLAIAFQSGAFLAIQLAVLGLGLRVIAAERNAPDLFHYRSRGRFLRPLTNFGFLLAWRITVQLPSYVAKYPSWLHHKIVVIPNPVSCPVSPAYPNENADDPKIILSLGRLSYQKNQTFLLRSFSLIATQFPEWRLVLVGDGEFRDRLHVLAEQLGLRNQVVFVGVTRNVDEWYARAAFLAFPSLWEGFPNALVEAFSHGVPVVGFSTTAGVNELIQNGETGLLSEPAEESFAAAMAALIDDKPLRQRLGRAAARSVAQYKPDRIFGEWARLFRSAGNTR